MAAGIARLLNAINNARRVFRQKGEKARSKIRNPDIRGWKLGDLPAEITGSEDEIRAGSQDRDSVETRDSGRDAQRTHTVGLRTAVLPDSLGMSGDPE